MRSVSKLGSHFPYTAYMSLTDDKTQRSTPSRQPLIPAVNKAPAFTVVSVGSVGKAEEATLDLPGDIETLLPPATPSASAGMIANIPFANRAWPRASF